MIHDEVVSPRRVGEISHQLDVFTPLGFLDPDHLGFLDLGVCCEEVVCEFLTTQSCVFLTHECPVQGKGKKGLSETGGPLIIKVISPRATVETLKTI